MSSATFMATDCFLPVCNLSCPAMLLSKIDYQFIIPYIKIYDDKI